MVDQISNALLAHAAEQASRWPAAVHLSFNLSAVELCSLALGERIMSIVTGACLDPARLQIEVTETALLADLHVARHNLAYLRIPTIPATYSDLIPAIVPI
jgi:predicted signal transduction protein with EAL and GGDEF domain